MFGRVDLRGLKIKNELTPSDVAKLRVWKADLDRTVVAYRHKFSPKKFSQTQLIVMVALQKEKNWSYRKVCKQLSNHPDAKAVLGLTHIPHFTTLQKQWAQFVGISKADSEILNILIFEKFRQLTRHKPDVSQKIRKCLSELRNNRSEQK